MKIRILLADDHELVREGLKELFEKQPDMEVVGEAADGQVAVRLAGELKPNVVIMDVGMPNLNGIEATRFIVRDWPSIKVLALSMHVHQRFVSEMLKAGVSGYIDKNSKFDELVRAVRTVLAGQRYLSPAIAGALVDDYIQQSSHTGDPHGLKLNDHERIILQKLAEGQSSKEIALYLKLGVKTVEAYRRHIMDKLDIHSVAELTKYAIQEGIIFLDA